MVDPAAWLQTACPAHCWPTPTPPAGAEAALLVLHADEHLGVLVARGGAKLDLQQSRGVCIPLAPAGILPLKVLPS